MNKDVWEKWRLMEVLKDHPQLHPDKDVTPSTRTKEQQSQLDCKCGLLLLFFPLLLANHFLLDECLF